MGSLFRNVSVACALAAIALAGQTVSAQDWGWGGGYNRSYDSPPEYGRRVYGQPDYYGGQPQRPPSYAPPPTSANPRCRELEYQLNSGAPAASTAVDQLPRIDGDMRQADMQYRRAQADADRSDCYEDMFVFGRSLRRTPRCLDLDRQIQGAKASLQQLKAQRDALTRQTSPRGRRDDIVAELARNRCGDNYVREYESQRSRGNSIFSFFSNEDSDDAPAPNRWSPTYGGAGTFRTLCVRECDGFYFPISNETTEGRLQEDDQKCRSQCAAPAELYYHRSDQDVDQMVSLSGRLYSQMPFAFRNRKVYVRGCSCNQGEYSREEIAKSEEALKMSKRADATPAGKAAGSDAAFAKRISQAVQNTPAPAATAEGSNPPANTTTTPPPPGPSGSGPLAQEKGVAPPR